MERSQFHYHVDIMTPDARLITSSPALVKSAARKLFMKTIDEYRQQVGKFLVRRATEADLKAGFIGSVKIAFNHKLVISLTRCDCDVH